MSLWNFKKKREAVIDSKGLAISALEFLQAAGGTEATLKMRGEQGIDFNIAIKLEHPDELNS